jgi:hypothetical protein
VRLIVTLAWCLAALIWLPWALFALRWVIDIALGAQWDQSSYFTHVCMGLWPRHGWLRPWSVVSWWPVLAAAAVALTAGGWRAYWLEQEGILSRPGWLVALSIIFPPLAPGLMLSDALRRYRAREAELDAEVLDARERLAR